MPIGPPFGFGRRGGGSAGGILLRSRCDPEKGVVFTFPRLRPAPGPDWQAVAAPPLSGYVQAVAEVSEQLRIVMAPEVVRGASGDFWTLSARRAQVEGAPIPASVTIEDLTLRLIGIHWAGERGNAWTARFTEIGEEGSSTIDPDLRIITIANDHLHAIHALSVAHIAQPGYEIEVDAGPSLDPDTGHLGPDYVGDIPFTGGATAAVTEEPSAVASHSRRRIELVVPMTNVEPASVNIQGLVVERETPGAGTMFRVQTAGGAGSGNVRYEDDIDRLRVRVVREATYQQIVDLINGFGNGFSARLEGVDDAAVQFPTQSRGRDFTLAGGDYGTASLADIAAAVRTLDGFENAAQLHPDGGAAVEVGYDQTQLASFADGGPYPVVEIDEDEKQFTLYYGEGVDVLETFIGLEKADRYAFNDQGEYVRRGSTNVEVDVVQDTDLTDLTEPWDEFSRAFDYPFPHEQEIGALVRQDDDPERGLFVYTHDADESWHLRAERRELGTPAVAAQLVYRNADGTAKLVAQLPIDWDVMPEAQRDLPVSHQVLAAAMAVRASASYGRLMISSVREGTPGNDDRVRITTGMGIPARAATADWREYRQMRVSTVEVGRDPNSRTRFLIIRPTLEQDIPDLEAPRVRPALRVREIGTRIFEMRNVAGGVHTIQDVIDAYHTAHPSNRQYVVQGVGGYTNQYVLPPPVYSSSFTFRNVASTTTRLLYTHAPAAGGNYGDYTWRASGRATGGADSYVALLRSEDPSNWRVGAPFGTWVEGGSWTDVTGQWSNVPNGYRIYRAAAGTASTGDNIQVKVYEIVRQEAPRRQLQFIRGQPATEEKRTPLRVTHRGQADTGYQLEITGLWAGVDTVMAVHEAYAADQAPIPDGDGPFGQFILSAVSGSAITDAVIGAASDNTVVFDQALAGGQVGVDVALLPRVTLSEDGIAIGLAAGATLNDLAAAFLAAPYDGMEGESTARTHVLLSPGGMGTDPISVAPVDLPDTPSVGRNEIMPTQLGAVAVRDDDEHGPHILVTYHDTADTLGLLLAAINDPGDDPLSARCQVQAVALWGTQLDRNPEIPPFQRSVYPRDAGMDGPFAVVRTEHGVSNRGVAVYYEGADAGWCLTAEPSAGRISASARIVGDNDTYIELLLSDHILPLAEEGDGWILDIRPQIPVAGGDGTFASGTLGALTVRRAVPGSEGNEWSVEFHRGTEPGEGVQAVARLTGTGQDGETTYMDVTMHPDVVVGADGNDWRLQTNVGVRDGQLGASFVEVRPGNVVFVGHGLSTGLEIIRTVLLDNGWTVSAIVGRDQFSQSHNVQFAGGVDGAAGDPLGVEYDANEKTAVVTALHGVTTTEEIADLLNDGIYLTGSGDTTPVAIADPGPSTLLLSGGTDVAVPYSQGIDLDPPTLILQFIDLNDDGVFDAGLWIRGTGVYGGAELRGVSVYLVQARQINRANANVVERSATSGIIEILGADNATAAGIKAAIDAFRVDGAPVFQTGYYNLTPTQAQAASVRWNPTTSRLVTTAFSERGGDTQKIVVDHSDRRVRYLAQATDTIESVQSIWRQTYRGESKHSDPIGSQQNHVHPDYFSDDPDEVLPLISEFGGAHDGSPTAVVDRAGRTVTLRYAEGSTAHAVIGSATADGLRIVPLYGTDRTEALESPDGFLPRPFHQVTDETEVSGLGVVLRAADRTNVLYIQVPEADLSWHLRTEEHETDVVNASVTFRSQQTATLDWTLPDGFVANILEEEDYTIEVSDDPVAPATHAYVDLGGVRYRSRIGGKENRDREFNDTTVRVDRSGTRDHATLFFQQEIVAAYQEGESYRDYIDQFNKSDLWEAELLPGIEPEAIVDLGDGSELAGTTSGGMDAVVITSQEAAVRLHRADRRFVVYIAPGSSLDVLDAAIQAVPYCDKDETPRTMAGTTAINGSGHTVIGDELPVRFIGTVNAATAPAAYVYHEHPLGPHVLLQYTEGDALADLETILIEAGADVVRLYGHDVTLEAEASGFERGFHYYPGLVPGGGQGAGALLRQVGENALGLFISHMEADPSWHLRAEVRQTEEDAVGATAVYEAGVGNVITLEFFRSADEPRLRFQPTADARFHEPETVNRYVIAHEEWPDPTPEVKASAMLGALEIESAEDGAAGNADSYEVQAGTPAVEATAAVARVYVNGGTSGPHLEVVWPTTGPAPALGNDALQNYQRAWYVQIFGRNPSVRTDAAAATAIVAGEPGPRDAIHITHPVAGAAGNNGAVRVMRGGARTGPTPGAAATGLLAGGKIRITATIGMGAGNDRVGGIGNGVRVVLLQNTGLSVGSIQVLATGSGSSTNWSFEIGVANFGDTSTTTIGTIIDRLNGGNPGAGRVRITASLESGARSDSYSYSSNEDVRLAGGVDASPGANPLAATWDGTDLTVTVLPTDTVGEVITEIRTLAGFDSTNVVRSSAAADSDLITAPAVGASLVYNFSGGTDEAGQLTAEWMPDPGGTQNFSRNRIFIDNVIPTDTLADIRAAIVGLSAFGASQLSYGGGAQSDGSDALGATSDPDFSTFWFFQGGTDAAPRTPLVASDMASGSGTRLLIVGLIATDTTDDVVEAYISTFGGDKFTLGGPSNTALPAQDVVGSLAGGRDEAARQLPTVAVALNGDVATYTVRYHGPATDANERSTLLEIAGAWQSVSGALDLPHRPQPAASVDTGDRVVTVPSAPSGGRNYVAPEPIQVVLNEDQEHVTVRYLDDEDRLQDILDALLAQAQVEVAEVWGTNLALPPEPPPFSRAFFQSGAAVAAPGAVLRDEAGRDSMFVRAGDEADLSWHLRTEERSPILIHASARFAGPTSSDHLVWTLPDGFVANVLEENAYEIRYETATTAPATHAYVDIDGVRYIIRRPGTSEISGPESEHPGRVEPNNGYTVSVKRDGTAELDMDGRVTPPFTLFPSTAFLSYVEGDTYGEYVARLDPEGLIQAELLPGTDPDAEVDLGDGSTLTGTMANAQDEETVTTTHAAVRPDRDVPLFTVYMAAGTELSTLDAAIARVPYFDTDGASRTMQGTTVVTGSGAVDQDDDDLPDEFAGAKPATTGPVALIVPRGRPHVYFQYLTTDTLGEIELALELAHCTVERLFGFDSDEHPEAPGFERGFHFYGGNVTVVSGAVQSDWEEDDPTSLSFIRNKPEIPDDPPEEASATDVADRSGTDFVSARRLPPIPEAYDDTALTAAVRTNEDTLTKLMALGIWNDRGNWATATAYEVRDVVWASSESSYFVCIVKHTSASGNQPPDATNWRRIGGTADGTAYDDTALRERLDKAETEITVAEVDIDRAEARLDTIPFPEPTHDNWADQSDAGVAEYTSAPDAGGAYGDYSWVTSGQSSGGGAVFVRLRADEDPERWRVGAPVGTWVMGADWEDVTDEWTGVAAGYRIWKAATTNNAAGNSIQSSTIARPDLHLWRDRGAYDSSTTYVVRDVVLSDGLYYVCISESTGNAPPNSTYWRQISADVPATLMNWRGAWSSSASPDYEVNDVVFIHPTTFGGHLDDLFICIQGHPSSTATDPPNDAYWQRLTYAHLHRQRLTELERITDALPIEVDSWVAFQRGDGVDRLVTDQVTNGQATTKDYNSRDNIQRITGTQTLPFASTWAQYVVMDEQLEPTWMRYPYGATSDAGASPAYVTGAAWIDVTDDWTNIPSGHKIWHVVTARASYTAPVEEGRTFRFAGDAASDRVERITFQAVADGMSDVEAQPVTTSPVSVDFGSGSAQFLSGVSGNDFMVKRGVYLVDVEGGISTQASASLSFRARRASDDAVIGYSTSPRLVRESSHFGAYMMLILNADTRINILIDRGNANSSLDAGWYANFVAWGGAAAGATGADDGPDNGQQTPPGERPWFQYSEDGAGDWVGEWEDGYAYMRIATAVAPPPPDSDAWSGPIRIQGAKGDKGDTPSVPPPVTLHEDTVAPDHPVDSWRAVTLSRAPQLSSNIAIRISKASGIVGLVEFTAKEWLDLPIVDNTGTDAALTVGEHVLGLNTVQVGDTSAEMINEREVVIGRYSDTSIGVFFPNNNANALLRIIEYPVAGGTATPPAVHPHVSGFRLTDGDLNPPEGDIAGDYDYEFAISQSSHVASARIVGFEGTAAEPTSVQVLATLDPGDYHGGSGTVTIPSVMLSAQGTYTVRLEVYETGQTPDTDSPISYADARITAHAPMAAAYHWGRIVVDANDADAAATAARVVFADDDLVTGPSIAASYDATPDTIGSWQFYLAVRSGSPKPTSWTSSGLNASNAFNAGTDRTISGIVYTFYVLKAGLARTAADGTVSYEPSVT